MPFSITSPAFAHEGEIPQLHTCQGDDVSPALAWSGAPEGTQGFALIVQDPDAPDPHAPKMIWSHWILYDLPAACTGLPQGVREKDLPLGTLQGVTDFKRTGWGGPCPPIGRHRYYFKLHALSVRLPDLGVPTRQRLESALEGHVLASAVLMGTYQKRR